MKPIEFTDYISFTEEIKKASLTQETVSIDLWSLVMQLDNVEMLVMLQMALSRIGVPCLGYFPRSKSGFDKATYEAYVQTFSKIEGLTVLTD